MPTFVRTDKCDGCKGPGQDACMYICPHDLMKLDKDGSDTGHAMKAYNQEPDQCWVVLFLREDLPTECDRSSPLCRHRAHGRFGAAIARF